MTFINETTLENIQQCDIDPFDSNLLFSNWLDLSTPF